MNRIGIYDFNFFILPILSIPVNYYFRYMARSRSPAFLLTARTPRAQNVWASVEKRKRGRAVGRINFRPDNLRRGLAKRMAYTKEEAVERARRDLAGRLGVAEGEVAEDSVEEADFPNAALGAPLRDEMSGMMITSGWRIRLAAGGQTYEYRADRNQLRLYDFKGANYKI